MRTFLTHPASLYWVSTVCPGPNVQNLFNKTKSKGDRVKTRWQLIQAVGSADARRWSLICPNERCGHFYMTLQPKIIKYKGAFPATTPSPFVPKSQHTDTHRHSTLMCKEKKALFIMFPSMLLWSLKALSTPSLTPPGTSQKWAQQPLGQYWGLGTAVHSVQLISELRSVSQERSFSPRPPLSHTHSRNLNMSWA